ncbi:hypothetical protein ID866_4915 [Astraeus odoratus]|nr:hypothetical protein ID866_4915 [Astraeus odoratus]
MSTTVNVFVVSPDTHSERRFDLHTTVEQLKVTCTADLKRPVLTIVIASQNKLELITGIPVQNQQILVQNSDGQTAAQLTDDAKQLGYYGLADLQTLKVIDTNPSTSFTGQLSDVSQVEKFELSDEAYAQRTGTSVS